MVEVKVEMVLSGNDHYFNNLILSDDLILSPTTPSHPISPNLFATKPLILTMIDQAAGQTCEGTEDLD